ncbi:Auxin-responsive protein IAA27 [Senna tora]|uniref:Auxin-induced protein n=1 Tax=Senna tora TaxID=362788 RepID=A0A834WAD9_9FABA|nr:Auxin-responsive protein IAA27 [Senna tora]
MSPPPLEHDYIGLSEKPLMEISHKFSSSSSSSLNLKETELRLGLPGCESPERKSASGVSLFGKNLQNNLKNLIVAGSKRGFCEAINDDDDVDVDAASSHQVDLRKGASFFSPIVSQNQNINTHKNNSQSAEAIQDYKTEVASTKAQVVGWPPIRSFRRNTLMACNNLTKNNEEEAKNCGGCLYVKVSMDGAPYLRKIDLKNYTNYMQLSSALEKMFTCFTIDGLSERSLRDLLHGSEYVLTYEDKDGDWMLVGDVPWDHGKIQEPKLVQKNQKGAF